MTVRKQDEEIMRGVRLLAKKECAYYDSGVCLCNEHPCRVIHPAHKTVHDGAIDCDFFLHAVLPAQPELNAAVWHEIFREEGRAGDGWKVCARCHVPFIPSCNRQRYCAGCGKESENPGETAPVPRKKELVALQRPFCLPPQMRLTTSEMRSIMHHIIKTTKSIG